MQAWRTPTRKSAIRSRVSVSSQLLAAHDFQSGTLTTPTKAMLETIMSTGYCDDGYAEGNTTYSLEARIAVLTSKKAGLLLTLGVMGNQFCVCMKLQHVPHSIVCDFCAHVTTAEAGGLSTLFGAMPILVQRRNERYSTLRCARKHCTFGGKELVCPTMLICSGKTLYGTIMPLEEIRRITYQRICKRRCHQDAY